MWQVIDPAKRLSLPGALVFFLLLSLVIITAMDIDFIADEAHIGGLVTGVLCGVIMAGFSRYRRGLKG
jgi:membrane associated rhomboid family serine protease